MSASLPNVFESISEYSASDIYKMIMQGYYYPGCFILHSIFIIFNIRLSSSRQKPISFYRSFILGYLMTTAPRYLLGFFTDRSLSEFENMATLKTFTIIWCLFNLFPFDILFKFLNRSSSKIVLSLLNSFSLAQNIYQSTYSTLMVFDGKPLRVFTIVVICICSTLIIDVLDRILISQRKFPMAYQFNSIKRNIIIIGVLILVGSPGIIEEGVSLMGMAELTNYTVIINILLTILDLIYFNGKIFYQLDLFFRDFWSIINYYPNSEKL